jgi:hypothetical protein
VIIYANLDQEARWARTTLPQAVLKRISAAAALLGSFAPDDEQVIIYAPAAVAADRIAYRTVEMRVGVPSSWDIAWADPTAERANDRRLALALAVELGIGLPGARVIESLAQLDDLLAAGGTDAGIDRRWVCKAPFTAAGRDRAHGHGPIADGEVRVHLGRMIEKFGAVTFEPWLERILDLGVCVQLRPDGTMHVDRPHTLLSDPRGHFQGIDIVEPALTEAEHDELARVVHASGTRLHGIGYSGAFTLDAFVYRDHGMRKLHPLCELNARHSFGHVARALHGRLGSRVLGFGPPPVDARVLVAAADDGVAAWVQ